eukprot:TRINITY_DN21220_c0_g1_i1.p1 TRINITY_DN21220_c0_g1~~TRINITY_DN21220_c0_g1_i1.p1  ORF type:complete len:188 (+),score=41.13 TRINITY_DN21220_c0_g1_i1:56-619(+)
MNPRAVLTVLHAIAFAGLLSQSTAERPSDRFEELQDLVGYYSLKVCEGMISSDHSRAEILRRKESCDMYSDRLEHMVAVSGNDAIIQLSKEADARKPKPTSKKKSKKNYYKKVVNVAGTGLHKQQLLKIARKGAEWLFETPHAPTKEAVSERLQPDIGQWLINVASNSDPAVTSKEMRDELPEPDIY